MGWGWAALLCGACVTPSHALQFPLPFPRLPQLAFQSSKRPRSASPQGAGEKALQTLCPFCVSRPPIAVGRLTTAGH